MTRNLQFKAGTKAISRELDTLEKDIQQDIQDATQETFRELLPRLLGGDTEGGAAAYQTAWTDAVEAVLTPRTPKAYIRTGGLADPNTVKVALFSQQIFPVFEPLPHQAGFSFCLTIILDPQYSYETHLENQESLDKIDGNKELRREIQYPHRDKPGTAVQYIYPALNSPHIEPQVVGSMWTQKKPYLIQYLLAGPNKSGPGASVVYRHLGHEGNKSAPRASERGGMILDEFMDIIGANHIHLNDSLVATTTIATGGRKGKVVNNTINLLGKALKGVMSIDINFITE
jgi:hypothetical protein